MWSVGPCPVGLPVPVEGETKVELWSFIIVVHKVTVPSSKK